jgi:hypothetical protein
VSSQTTTSDVDLTTLIEDAKRLQLAMLPRPRTLSPQVIDLTATEIRIPESTALMVDDLDPYGT